MSAPLDVLIAGAGPAGAATAIRLAREGFSVVAVDRSSFPRDKICAEYNGPEAVRHLALLGVLERLEREGGQAVRGTTVRAPFGASLTGRFAEAGYPAYRETGLSISRRILDHALVDAARAAGATVQERCAVVGVLRDGRGVAGLAVRDPEGGERVLRARVTIGADGLRSLVARAVGRRCQGRLRRIAFAAHLEGVPGLTDTAEMHVGLAGYAGLNPIGHGVTNVALVVPAQRAAEARGRVEEFFYKELDRLPGIRGRVHRVRQVREILVTGPFATRSASVIADGALLVGDAAEFFDPFTGEGICSALRGAELAAECLIPALARRGAVSRAQLAPYARARRRAFLGKWVVERAIGYLMLAPARFDRAVGRLDRRGLAHTLIGVTGDFVPPRAVLNPAFLSRVVF
jgi:flavin-dependent dehydrogenase